jgi:hypothetical protein
MRVVGWMGLSLAAACSSAGSQVAPRPATGIRPAIAGDTTGASRFADAWWRALTVGDTAHLQRHTAPHLTLTLSGGQVFDRASMLRDAATHRPAPSMVIESREASVVHASDGTVVVRSVVLEGARGNSNLFHYLTVLERAGSSWRVSAAQSTRELGLTNRVPAQVAGTLSDFAGSYRGPRGGVVKIAVRDSALMLTDPTGAESVLEPIGPSLFELPRLYDGIGLVRYVFARDASGRVTSLSRLLYGSVLTWPRVP